MPVSPASAPPPRRIRIPLLVDLVLVDHLASIEALDVHPALTRVVHHEGPLVNRILSRRIGRALAIGTRPLPTFTDRSEPGRVERQRELEERLTATAAGFEGAEIDALADYVNGRGDPERVGVAVQTVFGRLFDPDYRGTAATYRAACTVRDAPRALPPRSWWWALSGKLKRSQRLLGTTAGGDPVAIHAVTNTVHNVVETLTRMRMFARTAGPRVGATEATARSLAAPPALIRWCRAEAAVPGIAKPLRRGTLVVLRLDKAHDELRDTASPFLVGSWNQCPAHRYVLALLECVWNRARA